MRLWHQGIWLLQMARPAQALAAIADGWLIVFLAMAIEPTGYRNPQLAAWGMPGSLALAGVMAMGLSVFAVACNDMLDKRHDLSFEPDRPVASGRVRLRTALIVAMAGLVAGLASAVLLGRESALLALVAAMGILFYNLAGKHMPAVGIVTLGLVWALNMFIVSPQMGFAWPAWLSMSHVMIAATLAHAAGGKRPRLRPVDLAGIFAGWLFWTMALFAWMTLRDTTTRYDLPWVWAGPGAGVAAYLVLLAIVFKRKAGSTAARPARSKQVAAVALFSLMLIDAGWLMALGMIRQGMMLLGLLTAALTIQTLLAWAGRRGRDGQGLAYRVGPAPGSMAHE